jgi:AbrB family looped-hinge helix DNA binding protein
MAWIVKVDAKGRIVIPNEVRDKLGLKKGASLTLDIQESEIILST